MTEREICISYKGARQPNEQTQILADLNGMKRIEIIKILVENHVELAGQTVRYLQRRLDQLNEVLVKKEQKRKEAMEKRNLRVSARLEREIEKGECEYQEVAEILNTVKA